MYLGREVKSASCVEEGGALFTGPWAVWVGQGQTWGSRLQLPGGRTVQSSWRRRPTGPPQGGQVRQAWPRKRALHLPAVLLGQSGTTTPIVPPNSSLLIPEKRKPWGHLDQASAGRMLPFLCSSGSQSHGINSSEAGSPLGGLGSFPYGHMAPNTLFFVTAAWLGGPRTSADKDTSGAPRAPWKVMKEPLSSHPCPRHAQLTWTLGPPRPAA